VLTYPVSKEKREVSARELAKLIIQVCSIVFYRFQDDATLGMEVWVLKATKH
jgi:hypothetical protein